VGDCIREVAVARLEPGATARLLRGSLQRKRQRKRGKRQAIRAPRYSHGRKAIAERSAFAKDAARQAV